MYVWNGHNYAPAIVERLGLLEAGGMIRVGPVHYNTLEEIERFREALIKVILAKTICRCEEGALTTTQSPLERYHR